MNASNRSLSFLRAAGHSKFVLMENFSIPNSTPAIGRTLTQSSAQLKKSNKFPSTSRRPIVDLFAIRNHCQSGSDQSALRRVKGAWWPSRSSKPSSPRKWRGRFDSCPLRFCFLYRRQIVVTLGKLPASRDGKVPPSPTDIRNHKGGESNVARADS